MKKYQMCTRCVMDNLSDQTIVFDQNGYCNYCTDTLQRKDREYFPNPKGKEKLEQLVGNIKMEGKNNEYDCIVGISGGVDSSYILYLGYQYDLRMLAVHIDDELDTDIASENINRLCIKTKTKLINVKPDMDAYKDATLAFFKAGVPNVAIIQDNLIVSELQKCAEKYGIHYSLAGANFALESILQRGCTHNAFDLKHIHDIEKKFGTVSWKSLNFIGFFEKYLGEKYFTRIKKVYPLNYVEYDLEKTLDTLRDFCGYEYYGGKHYESILTRFMQCYYLPSKFNFDKRKSHFSSMIVSNQMTRQEALERLKTNPYIKSGMYENDLDHLSQYFGLERNDFEAILKNRLHMHDEYKVSAINKSAPLARRCRKFLG